MSKAHGQGDKSASDPSLDPILVDYVEAKVDSVRVTKGQAPIVYLRLLNGTDSCLPVHIGEFESAALLREMAKEYRARPWTHDLTKDLVMSVGFRVTKIRISEIIANTYYARIHVGRTGAPFSEEQDVDARPSDAINLAMRFNAPIFIHKHMLELAVPLPPPPPPHETVADITSSVRAILSEFKDPTIMHTLQKELAVQEQRFKDAHLLQQRIVYEMTHNQLLRVVVAMESALGDGRYEEAARLRDEYYQLTKEQCHHASAAGGPNGGGDTGL